MLRKIGVVVLFAFIVYFLVTNPTESGSVVETVGKVAGAGFDSFAEGVVGFLRDHNFMQGG